MSGRKERHGPAVQTWSMTDGLCFYCGCAVRLPVDRPVGDAVEMVREHYIPRHLAKGLRGNIVPACRSCNARKGRGSISEFRRHQSTRGISSFTIEQSSFLMKHGVQIDKIIARALNAAPDYVFWAESNGWVLSDDGFHREDES